MKTFFKPSLSKLFITTLVFLIFFYFLPIHCVPLIEDYLDPPSSKPEPIKLCGPVWRFIGLSGTLDNLEDLAYIILMILAAYLLACLTIPLIRFLKMKLLR